MSFNTAGVLNRVDAILATVTGVQESQIGVPASFAAKVSSYCTISGQSFPEAYQQMGGASYGRLTRTARILIGFAYAVGSSNPSTTDAASIALAETTLAAYVDDCIRKILGDSTLKGLCEDFDLRLDLNDLPEYRDWASREVRHFYVLLEFQQSESI